MKLHEAFQLNVLKSGPYLEAYLEATVSRVTSLVDAKAEQN